MKWNKKDELSTLLTPYLSRINISPLSNCAAILYPCVILYHLTLTSLLWKNDYYICPNQKWSKRPLCGRYFLLDSHNHSSIKQTMSRYWKVNKKFLFWMWVQSIPLACIKLCRKLHFISPDVGYGTMTETKVHMWENGKHPGATIGFYVCCVFYICTKYQWRALAVDRQEKQFVTVDLLRSRLGKMQ